MRTNLLIIAGCIIAALAFTWLLDFQGRPTAAHIKSSELNLTLTTLDGKSIQLSDYRGKIILLNFWATWCPPCVIEFPQMLELTATNKDIIFIAVSVDENEDAIERFLKKQNQKHTNSERFITAHDPGRKTAHNLGIKKFPETIIIGKDGRIKDKIVGAIDWLSDETEQRLSH